MKMMTINISMPVGLYKQAQKHGKKYHYASVSEMVRNALRWWMSDNLTVNGFTEEFEDEVLEAEKEADKGNVIEWDGKGSFSEFVLREGAKKFDKNKGIRKVLPKLQKPSIRKSGTRGHHRTESAVV